MIKQQLKDLIFCLYVSVPFIMFGIICGFYDYTGVILFDLPSAIRSAYIFGMLGFVMALAYKISQYYNKGENNE